ncbi:hypothetical protein [Burkholderia glumae]|uniref:hypothetical protein n=1 Tax=Burkholderia glumae TaxID=337 RepID=UPI00215030D6|nr:hypothetical protein [Burkholderia glumae]
MSNQISTLKNVIDESEVTLIQAVVLLGEHVEAKFRMNCIQASRYLRNNGVKYRRVAGERIGVLEYDATCATTTINVYPRHEVEALAQRVAADLEARRKDIAARRTATMRRERQEAAKAAAMKDDAPYLVHEHAAALLGKGVNDPLFHDEERLQSYTDPDGVRWFARDDLMAFVRQQHRQKRSDMRSVLAAFTARASEARAWKDWATMDPAPAAEEMEEYAFA